MSDWAIGLITLAVLIALGSAAVGIYWWYQTDVDEEAFYQRMHERELKRREGGPPGI